MSRSLLSSVDLIGIPVAMSLFGNEKSKTNFGGVCSILFFGFVCWAIYNCSHDLFSTLNPKIVDFDSYNGDPRAIVLSRENFPMGFNLQAPDFMNYMPYKDPTIYNIEIIHNLVQWKRTPSGRRIPNYTVSKIYTEDCTKEHFAGQDTAFTTMSFDAVTCIALKQPELEKLEIQGVLSSWTYQEIIVSVLPCNNATHNNTCASPEKIDMYLSGGWFNALYPNMVVNPQNYTHPNASYKDIYYTMISPANYRETELQLGYVEIATDRGWLTESLEKKAYVKVNDIKEFLQTKPHPEKILINCIIKMSQLENYYTRSYKKIQEVLAEVGSLASFALAAMIILTNAFLKMKFRESLMNHLFDVQEPPKPKKKRSGKRKGSKKGIEEKAQEDENKDKNQEFTKIVLSDLALKSKDQLPDFNESGPLKSPTDSAKLLMSQSFTRNQSFNFEDRNRKKFAGFSHFPSFPLESPSQSPRREPREELEETTIKHMSSIKSPEIGEAIVIEKEQNHKLSNFAVTQTKTKQPKPEPRRTDTALQHVPKADFSQVEMKSIQDEESLHISFSEAPKSEIEQEENFDSPKAKIEQQPVQKAIERIEIMEKPRLSLDSSFRSKSKVLARKLTHIKNEIHLKVFNRPLGLEMSFWEYVKWMFFRPKSMRPKGEVFEEGLKNINDRLEIVNILKKMKEFDNLKSLLLDHDQSLLFRSLPKTIISSKDPKAKKHNLSNTFIQNAKFIEEKASEEEILAALRNLSNKMRKTEVDYKLMEVFKDQI